LLFNKGRIFIHTTLSLQLVEARFQYGAVTELDVQQARNLLYSTESLVPRLQLSLYQTRHALAILLGIPPEELGNLVDGVPQLPVVPSSVATGMPADLLRRRPDVRQAELLAGAQGARIGVAQAELYPSFYLFGTLGWSATDVAGASLDDPGFGASFGPSFRWPIFHYGRLRNRVRVADAQFEQTLINYQNVVLNAAREVEDAMTGFYRSS
jgi:outer membrane protein TolC